MAGLFDDLIPQPSQQQGSGLFDDLIPQQPPPSGAWNNATAGLNEAIYSTIGAPVDAATRLTNKAVQGINAATGAELPQARPNLPGSSQWLAGVGEAAGVNDPAKVQATTQGEKVARAAGSGIGFTLAPEAAIGALGRAGVLGEGAMNALAPFVGRSTSAGDVALSAGIGGAAGAGGELAAEAAPEKYRPLGEMVGNLLGGGAAVGALAAGRGAAEAGRAAADWLAPVTQAGQERAAGAMLRDAATDPAALRASLEQMPPDFVPGSRPTTFQATGDMGLGGLERAVSTQNPAEFMQRRADQNMARVGALQGIQPAGAPDMVVGALRQNLADLDALTGQAVEAATGRARGATAGLGGELPPEAYGAALRGLEAPKVDAARAEAQGAMRALGGDGTPEGYGSAMRQQVMDARASAKAHERALWKAVDPNGDLNLYATGTRDTARRMVNELERSAAPLAGEERATIEAALQYPDVIPFREMTALRSRVSDALRQELSINGQTRVYARLSQLRGAIERDIENAVEHKAAVEQRAVQAGAMSEEDTMAARIHGWTSNWYDQRASEAQMGQGFAEGVGGNASRGPASFSAASGANWARGRGFGETPGREGVQSPGLFADLIPNFDEGAAGRLKAASDATRGRVQTFDAGRVGGTIRRSGAAGPFQMAASAVPQRFFQAGPQGYESVQALRQAVGPQAADAMLSDYAISTLRQVATRQDGTLDPAGFLRWRSRYGEALRAFPELMQRVGTAEHASRLLDASRAIPEGIMDAAVPARIFRPGPGGAESVNAFRTAVGDQQATAVLQDYAVSSLRQAAEHRDGPLMGTLDPAKVRAWRQKHGDALRAIPEVDRMLADPVAASEAVAKVAADRKAQMDAYQQGTVGRLLGLDDPADVTRTIGGIFSRQDAVQQMARLAREAAGNPEARQGLRKAVSGYINLRFVGNTEGATSGADLLRSDAFQQFLRQSGPALRTVLSEDEMKTLGAIAADLKRSNRSVAAVKLPGGSNTVQDLTAISRSQQQPSILSRVLSLAGSAGVGAVTGGPLASIAAVAGTEAVQAMRRAGLRNVDDLVRDALLNPERARALLAKAPVRPNKVSDRVLARAYARGAVLPTVGNALQGDGQR